MFFGLWKKENFKNEIIDYSGILVGSAICGAGFSLFLIPYNASPGGVGALSQVLLYLLNVPASIGMLLFNIPLFILGVAILGKNFGVKTLWSLLCVSFFTQVFDYSTLSNIEVLKTLFKKIPNINYVAYSFTSEYFLGVLAGAVLLGAGLGIVFKFNGSTGGTDIPALVMKKYFGISTGMAILIIDSIVILIASFTLKDANIVLWGFFSIFVTSKVCDTVIEGLPYNKGLMIVSNNPEKIQNYIMETLDVGCTILSAKGGYSKQNKNVVYTVMGLKDLSKLEHWVKINDKEAFIIVNEVHNVFGNGFKRL